MCVGFCGNRIPLIGLVGDGLYVLICITFVVCALPLSV